MSYTYVEFEYNRSIQTEVFMRKRAWIDRRPDQLGDSNRDVMIMSNRLIHSIKQGVHGDIQVTLCLPNLYLIDKFP